jgi:hypothetical protein
LRFGQSSSVRFNAGTQIIHFQSIFSGMYQFLFHSAIFYLFSISQHGRKRTEAVSQLLDSVQMEAMRLKSARNENATSKLVAVLLSIKLALAQMDSTFVEFIF